MSERGRVTANNGLRLRDSPRDGLTLGVVAVNEELEVLGRETWLRVKHAGRTGFVLADYVEPIPAPQVVPEGIVHIIDVPFSNVFRGAALCIDAEFETAVRGIERIAESLDLVLWITSSLREPYQPVAGAVAGPARFSNHHVGHALDTNIIHAGRWYRSTELGKPDQLPQPIQTFLRRIREELDLRWGGDFTPPDPVHIDDNLNGRDRAAFAGKLRALWG